MRSLMNKRPIIALAAVSMLAVACNEQDSTVVSPARRGPARAPSLDLGPATVWDFVALAGFTGPLGSPKSFTITGAGTIVATAQAGLTPAAQVYSKGFELPVGDPERGLGLCRDWYPDGNCAGGTDAEIGDDYTGVGVADGMSPSLYLDFTGLNSGMVQSVTLGSLQLGEGYQVYWSADGVNWTLMVKHETGPTDPLVVTLPVPTGAEFLRFDRDPDGVAGDNYVLMSVTTVNTTNIGNQGCTPGYWKQTQHFDSWLATGYTTSQLLSTVFTVPATDVLNGTPMGSYSLLSALSFKGGSTVSGKAQILLRAGVAALLNAGNPSVAYALTTSQIVSAVNAALASGDLTTITNEATALDKYNNGGCTLN